MIKKFTSFYNKDNADYSEGYVDPFEFHRFFYKILVTFKVADLKNPNPPSLDGYLSSTAQLLEVWWNIDVFDGGIGWSPINGIIFFPLSEVISIIIMLNFRYFNQNALLFLNGLLATIMLSFSTYYGLVNFILTHATEAGSYTFLLIYKLLILYCTRKNITQYHNLLRALKQDFHYICTAGEKYRARYFDGQLQTWKICILMCIFNAGIPIAMIIFAFVSVLYFLATRDANTEESRPLLFPFWLPNVDFSKSPVYEVAFMFANITVILFAYNYNFMSQTQIVWIRQITSRVDIVIWSLQDLLVDVYPTRNKEERDHFTHMIESRMRDVIIHHNSMYRLLEDYAIVYKKLLMFEQIFCGPVVCFSAYCIAEKFDNGEFQFILLLLFTATLVLHFIPSFMCTYLDVKVKSVGEACWNIPFWNAGPVIRPYIVLIIQRSMRPLPLQAPGFKGVTIETFSQTMTSAYSYFNVLRA